MPGLGRYQRKLNRQKARSNGQPPNVNDAAMSRLCGLGPVARNHRLQEISERLGRLLVPEVSQFRNEQGSAVSKVPLGGCTAAGWDGAVSLTRGQPDRLLQLAQSVE